jgi:hypothetical protein
VSGFSFSHLSPEQVLLGYSRAKASNRAFDALLLAYLAEIDAQKLYLETAHSSMYAFVIAEFDVTDDVAKKRIRAARTAADYPQVFSMLSDGRLSLSTFALLIPYLNRGNVEELLSSAANKTRSELERILAARFPSTELMSWTTGPNASFQPTTSEQNNEAQGAPGHPQPIASPLDETDQEPSSANGSALDAPQTAGAPANAEQQSQPR